MALSVNSNLAASSLKITLLCVLNFYRKPPIATDGRQLKSYSLSNTRMNNVTIRAGTLASGQYTYSLIADGKKIDTKNMILTK